MEEILLKVLENLGVAAALAVIGVYALRYTIPLLLKHLKEVQQNFIAEIREGRQQAAEEREADRHARHEHAQVLQQMTAGLAENTAAIEKLTPCRYHPAAPSRED